MKILIIGGGGREHALATAYAKSRRVKKVFVAPGNDFMEESNSKIQTLPDIDVFAFEKIVEFAKKENIDLVDVAQDDPLAAGLVDILDDEGIHVFGPTQKAAEIEWNKAWARIFMQRYKLPIPPFQHFASENEGIKYINAMPETLQFIKAAGLAAGKGVIRAGTKKEATDAIKQMKRFGKSGKRFLIEEGMTGEEFSLFAICDGKNYITLGSAQDHKTVYNADQGPNTGGMGCVSPAGILSETLLVQIRKTILDPLLRGMQKEDRPYTGILYLGGMQTKQGIRIVEFNARWGDPEAQVILPGLSTDYVSLVESVLMQRLNETPVRFDNNVQISIAGCAKGYPEHYKQAIGKKIFGLQKAMSLPDISIYGAGMKRRGKGYVVNGGRIFHLVAEGKTIQETRARAYEAMSYISVEGNNLHYRTDIGWRDVIRNSKS